MTARLLGVLGAVVLAVVTAGCSTVIDGAAVKDPTAAADAVNTALLQPGNYPTVPFPPTPPSARAGAIADAHGLADHVVVPWEVDPALTEPIATAVGPGIAAPFLNLVLRAPGPDIAAAHGFINAFASSRAETGPMERRRQLINVVMRFDSDQDAAAVANDAHQQMEPPLGASPQEPVNVAGHPEALAMKATNGDGTFVMSFTAHGPYVLFQESKAPDAAAAENLVAKTLDMQLPAIDSFTLTDPAQFATMDTDPTHLWARTLQTGKAIPAMGVYGQGGVLHYMQPEQRQWLEAAGVDAVSLGMANRVYQTRDAAAALGLADNIAKGLGEDAKPGPSVPGMPSARCFTGPNAGPTTCVATADRWAILTASQQARDAAQQLAAQYLMLVGK
ncbi:hypothetical protein BVU76_29805 [Mycolicibacterium porcinum]|nr:hypothetical protein BVU76_29805 [Mycolicibacterium porcinum]